MCDFRMTAFSPTVVPCAPLGLQSAGIRKSHTSRLLVGPTGFSTAGVPVELPSGTTVIFARMSNLLSDGDGFRITCDWKGHASMKPCFKHWSLATSHVHAEK